jgi:hypothetical protein
MPRSTRAGRSRAQLPKVVVDPSVSRQGATTMAKAAIGLMQQAGAEHIWSNL